MDTLSTHILGGTHVMRRGEEGEEEQEEEEEEKQEEEEEEEGEEEEKQEDGGEEDKVEEKDESATQTQQRPVWAPGFYISSNKEVYDYVGEKIVIEGVLDCYAGTALALCHYLVTHQQQLSLLDKTVLEIGAGTGLMSVVAAFLGASVTATDLPEVVGKLRSNVMRNTRHRCKHTPQVAALSWGQDLESTFPTSVHRYDYVLAADVVYHHDFLDELLLTMKYFCKPGTTLIWANKVRFVTDLTFTENFKKAFHTSLLTEDGEMKIFIATCKEEEGESDLEIKDLLSEKKGKEKEGEESNERLVVEKHQHDIELNYVNIEQSKEIENNVAEEPVVQPARGGDGKKEEKNKHESEWETEMEEIMVPKDDNNEEDEETDREKNVTADQQDRPPAWVPSTNSRLDRDVYHYAGQDIVIHESIDSFGAVMWPAALALCSFLDNNRKRVNLQEKEVLELGAGTGLVTIVASLLGASVTATDLPEVLGNLRSNVMRNTRERCKHTPQVAALSWGQDLESTFPTSVHRYDYVLAADVVYHHDFLDELLVTMKHFCKPGTTLIWANKVRFVTDLSFTENFKKAFHTSLLAEDGEMKIFMATCRE
ncbi:uncharacterized protein [Clinocottus analis]|uniref:uncharacterized protein isoform X2 n=1 Tax=Clinocottus analis TaxID=304258 RepID=UPI0035C18E34